MLSWDDVLVRNPQIVTRESDNELVVVLPDQGRYVVLNATGSRVLLLSDGTHTLEAVAVAIAEEFTADPDQVRRDVLHFAGALVERGILSVART
ncbi:MAG: PqqD family protein [Anaerolineae bacterium]|nr:PqqD family protein [Anaerolineae bacterium]